MEINDHDLFIGFTNVNTLKIKFKKSYFAGCWIIKNTQYYIKQYQTLCNS